MRLVAVLLLLAPALAADQAPRDSLRALPPYSRYVRGDFRPPQTSAVRAYLYSATATGGLVATGVLLFTSVPPDPQSDVQGAIKGLGGALVVGGLLLGPAAGNLSLGAGSDIERITGLELRALAVGGGAAVVGLGVALVCVLDVSSGDDCVGFRIGEGLAIGGSAIAVAGLAIGTGYDLATIPGNARRALRVGL